MPKTYPLTTFLDGARLGAGCSFSLQGYQETGRTAAGLLLTANLADPIWVAQYVTTGTMPHKDAEALASEIYDMQMRGLLFEAYNPVNRNPSAYPTGVFPGDGLDNGTIDNLPTDTSQIRIAGLPANFVIRRGDLFHFDYGASSKFRALHMAAEDITANGSGLTEGGFTVTPPIRTGATTGLTVRFRDPRCYMAIARVDPPVAVDKLHSQVRWQAVQVHAKP